LFPGSILERVANEIQTQWGIDQIRLPAGFQNFPVLIGSPGRIAKVSFEKNRTRSLDDCNKVELHGDILPTLERHTHCLKWFPKKCDPDGEIEKIVVN
jgi:hypothetical protein